MTNETLERANDIRTKQETDVYVDKMQECVR